MSDVFEGHVTRLEAYGLQGLSLVVVEVAWKHAVTWLLGKLRQEVRQVSLENKVDQLKNDSMCCVCDIWNMPGDWQ